MSAAPVLLLAAAIVAIVAGWIWLVLRIAGAPGGDARR